MGWEQLAVRTPSLAIGRMRRVASGSAVDRSRPPAGSRWPPPVPVGMTFGDVA